MKIAHVLWAPKIGGAELFAVRLARQQAKEHDVTMLYLGVDDESVNGIWAESLETRCFSARNGYDFRSFRQLLAHLRRVQYDVVHQHQAPSVLPFVRYGARSALLVKHEHGRASVASRSRRQRFLGYLTKRLVDVFIANSDYTKDQLMQSEGINPDKIEVVMGGVELDVFKQDTGASPLRQDMQLGNVPLVLFLGRLVWEKGIDDFLEVALRISRVQPETRFIIAGDGPLRDEIVDRVRQMQLEEVVVLLGFRQDVPDIMRECDVFLMTSRKEAQGLTVIEAMASGLPVISFDAGGLPEIVGEAGMIVRDRSTDEMARLTVDLLQDDLLRQRTVKKSREHVENYSFAQVATDVLAIYQAGA